MHGSRVSFECWRHSWRSPFRPPMSVQRNRPRPRSASRRPCRRRRGRCSSGSCCGPRTAPARSSSTATSTTGAILECVERWGGDDGPDDAIENVNDWPILYALGGADSILPLFKKAWEGTPPPVHRGQDHRGAVRARRHVLQGIPRHVRLAAPRRGPDGLQPAGPLRSAGRPVPAARPTLCRVLHERGPGAPNYDPKLKIIRSLFNGSRGPLLRKATALDWAGDPIEVENRFRPGHGERSYAQMLEHFKDYNDIVGDHP